MTERFDIYRESNFIINIIETLRFLFQEVLPEIRFQRRRRKEILRLWNARPHSKRNMYKKNKLVQKSKDNFIVDRKEQIKKLGEQFRKHQIKSIENEKIKRFNEKEETKTFNDWLHNELINTRSVIRISIDNVIYYSYLLYIRNYDFDYDIIRIVLTKGGNEEKIQHQINVTDLGFRDSLITLKEFHNKRLDLINILLRDTNFKYIKTEEYGFKWISNSNIEQIKSQGIKIENPTGFGRYQSYS